MQGFTFEYELVPGVPSQQSDNLFRYLVQIDYDADVELPWEPIDGGALAPFRGGPTTHGSRRDWPLPVGARELRSRCSVSRKTRHSPVTHRRVRSSSISKPAPLSGEAPEPGRTARNLNVR